MRGDRVLERILAPIQADLDHPQVTDICVNKPQWVWIRKAGVWEHRHIPSFDFDTLDAATILIGQRLGREFDEANPYVNSTLPGRQRFQGVRPPGTLDNYFLWAIRRPPTKARTVYDDDFESLFDEIEEVSSQRRKKVTEEVIRARREKRWTDCFVGARIAGLAIGFCGSTGSGKTDMARRMIQVGRNVRTVTIETDDEYGEAGQENKAPIIYDESQITADEAVRVAKRLIPVEIFFQEIRGEEAYSLVTCLNSGHSGCTSWHANEGLELEALAEMYRMHRSGRTIEEGRLMAKLRSAFDIIVYCEFDGKRHRVSSVRLMAEEEEVAR